MTALLLGLLPSLLLIAGGCVLAVWAKGLKDEQSALVSRLTTPPEIPAAGRPPRQEADVADAEKQTPQLPSSP